MANLSEKSAALQRLELLFDDADFTRIDAFAKSSDGSVEVAAGFGTVNGAAVYAFSQDIAADGGAVSKAQCATIQKIYGLAQKTGCPVVGIYDSNGMKVSQGIEALAAYGDVLKASTSVSGVVPQISLILGPCLGTSSLVAQAADVVVAVKDAECYLGAPSETTAQDNFANGTFDVLCDTEAQAIDTARQIVSLLPSNNLAPLPVFDFSESGAAPSAGMPVLDTITAAADAGSVIELKAGFAENKVVTALATVMGSTVGFVGYGAEALCPCACEKAAAFVRLCDAYSIPVVSLVDTQGFKKGETAEQKGIVKKATALACTYAGATTPKITLVTGQAVGAAYIALAGRGSNADLAFAWNGAVLSALDPDAAVAFLYNDRLAAGEDRSKLVEEYKSTEASAMHAAEAGCLDDVFDPADTRAKLCAALDVLSGKREATIARKHSVK